MIGLDRIIRILLHDMARRGQQLIEHPQVGRGPVGIHLARPWAVLKGSGEEPVGGYPVPLGRHQHVNDLPELVDRAVEIDPPPGNFDICFVNKPSIPGDVPAGACRVDQQRVKRCTQR